VAADVVLCDEVDLGAAVAAEAADVALVRVVVIAAGGFLLPEVIAPALDVVRAHHGLEPDPQLERLHSRLLISPVPPGFRDPHDPLPDAALSIRPGPDTVNGDAAPAWMDGLDPARPTVYATLGTIFNMESGDLFPRVLAALQGITANTVLSVGPQLDPRQFAAHRGVRVERWVPHEHLLPRCDVAVTHAGSGSVVAALTHGVPLVLLPMGADQRNNARRCEVLGVGVTLDPLRCAPADVRAAVERLLTDPSFRDRANAVKAAVDALPGPRSAVAFLQDLASV
jgi:UDP:flavonoid glycosyltransferase YjiC (YdhE family)